MSPGEESHDRRRCGSDDRGAAGLRPDQAIKEARCVRVLNNNRGRRWRLSVRPDKRSERFGVGKETVGGKSGIVSAKSQPQAQGSSIVSMRWDWKSTQSHQSALKKAATTFRSSSTIPRSMRRSMPICSTTRPAKATRCFGRALGRTASKRRLRQDPARTLGRGLLFDLAGTRPPALGACPGQGDFARSIAAGPS